MLDTSTVILLPRLPTAELPLEPVLSAVTLAELSVGPLIALSDESRNPREFEGIDGLRVVAVPHPDGG